MIIVTIFGLCFQRESHFATASSKDSQIWWDHSQENHGEKTLGLRGLNFWLPGNGGFSHPFLALALVSRAVHGGGSTGASRCRDGVASGLFSAAMQPVPWSRYSRHPTADALTWLKMVHIGSYRFIYGGSSRTLVGLFF